MTTACITSLSSWAGTQEPIMFGTVTHANGESVTGSIRWGDDQETFLSDIFNGNKLKTVGIEHLSADEIQALEEHQPGPKAQLGDVQITFKSFFGKELKLPAFNIPFGAIKRIDSENNLFTITLHDGSTFQSDDEANDTSDDIYVLTTEGQTSEFDIEDLSSIVFSAAPADAKAFGQGIYGTIASDLGTFKGRVMWDKDERILTEELDGNDESQEHEIKFAEIKSIEKVNEGNASKVQLRDGKTLTLTGTNDVNNGHRGIWLDHPDLGRMEIKWAQFNKLTIENVDVDWLDFNDYVTQAKILSGTVTLKDNSQITANQIAFDLNQQSQSERISVEVNNANRLIPLNFIKKITVKNEQAVELSMHDMTELIAYGTRSVDRDNNGLMVTTAGKHKWYRWSEIKSIELD